MMIKLNFLVNILRILTLLGLFGYSLYTKNETLALTSLLFALVFIDLAYLKLIVKNSLPWYY